ncbi:hypothetical protein HW555_013221 [Spodoptera exigua]|uniref:MADF domain-containing protein n=1 Tax=Spodoptera exigua TaxID=7107 RepID=A0A835G238_SPOEX|nr:hypothetical protein HW555_013221 [Spodoptera exigua]
MSDEHRCLWDTSDEIYKDKFIKQEAWKSICEIVYVDYKEKNSTEKSKLGNDLVKKWKAIKDNFAKYQKKLKDANRSGAGAAKIKEYHLNKQLQFLKKVSQNATDSSLCVAEGDIENEITALPRYKSQPRKRKADDKDDIEEDLLAILKTPENRHLHFFKGILPSLQSLNENQTLIFQSRVLQILTDILQPSIHQNTHHGYNQEYQHQGYNQGYSTMRCDNTVQSGYHTSTPGSSITEQRTTSSSNQQRPINSPFLLDETSATSYVSQDEEETSIHTQKSRENGCPTIMPCFATPQRGNATADFGVAAPQK